ncbi:DNA ligase D [Amycolatopsis sp. NPDC051373]|uniref:DNA ligase D n=1 Tax=Amycolatopsis sp. NPDC051373 TaxID=3155801 RepID=UPI00344E96D7
MLAKPDGGWLPSGPQWVYEHKLDGYRCCLRVAPDGTTALTSRNDKDMTAEFSELTSVFGTALDGEAVVLDGEVVVYNEAGQVDFELLQQRRGQFQRQPKASLVPPRFLAFDVLQLGGQALLDQPYETRRRLLTGLPMPDPFRLAVVPAFTFDELTADRLTPQALLDRVAADGLEGLIAKLKTSTYQPGHRTDTWLKHPLIQTAEGIVCGWRPGQRSFSGILGGLLLGAHDPQTGDLVYIGDVGTGFSTKERARLQELLKPLEQRTHPFAATPPREDTVRARWVTPQLVGEVVYRQFTRGAGRLRHTAWRGLRTDKPLSAVLVPAPTRPLSASPKPLQEPAAAPIDLGERVTVQVEHRRLTLSNLDKVLYPADGFTKSEVIHFYSQIAPLLLPHLKDRPITFVRWPDGVESQQWFEKNVPRGAPPWLRAAELPSTGSRAPGKTIHYPLIDDLPGLVWAANLAALELHVPQWKVDAGGHGLPDRLVFDLDPGPGASLVECCRVAERLHDVLVAEGLQPYPKTSGSKGMQLYAAISTTDAKAPSAYAKRVAQLLAQQTPDTVTTVMAKAARTGRVFIDWSQNNPAKTTIAPYSLRGRENPTVSTPVTWDEVHACREPAQLTFTADNVLDRVSDLGDLLAALDEHHPPLPAG